MVREGVPLPRHKIILGLCTGEYKSPYKSNFTCPTGQGGGERSEQGGVLSHKAQMRLTGEKYPKNGEIGKQAGSPSESGKFICRYPSKWILTRKINENLIK